MDFGTILLWASLLFTIVAIGCSFLFFITKVRFFRKYAILATLASIVTITLAFLLLMHYFLTSNFEIHYVWANSCNDLDWSLKLSGIWTGQEGTILLWVWIILLVLGIEEAIQYRKRSSNSRYSNSNNDNDPNDSDNSENNENSITIKENNSMDVYDWTRLIVMAVVLVFLILLVMNDPFEPTHMHEITYGDGTTNEFDPEDYPYGFGMNPMLRNIWMVIHPPILFIGYALITMPFAGSLSYSITGDRKWINISLLWSRLGWIFLTLGIGIGAVWAYVALGWGGYWGWDPVEVGSLLPWITLSAFLHAQLMNKRKKEYSIITPILGTSTFVLVLFVTFITRSGFWSSVHSWTETEVGLILGTTMIGTLVISSIIIIRSIILKKRNNDLSIFDEKPFKNEDSKIMLWAIILFIILTFITIFGLMTTIQRVDPLFYETLLAPFITILLIVMSICLCWRYVGIENSYYIVAVTSLAGIACAVILPGHLFPGKPEHFYGSFITSHNMVGFIIPFAMLGIICSIYKMIKQVKKKSIRNSLKSISPHIIHLGVVLIIIGYLCSQTMVTEKTQKLQVEDTMEFGKFKIKVIEIGIQENTGDIQSPEMRDTWFVAIEIYENNNLLEKGKMNMVSNNYREGDIRIPLFSLNTDYRASTQIGPVDETIRNIFKMNRIYLSKNAKITVAEKDYFYIDHNNNILIRMENFLVIDNGKNIYLIQDIGTDLIIFGCRDYTSVANSEVFVSQMLFEDLYISFFGISNNEIQITLKTVPMMSYLWGGMWLFVIGIVIRISIDYIPKKKLSIQDVPKIKHGGKRLRPLQPGKLMTGKKKKDYNKVLEKELKKIKRLNG